MLVTKDPMQDLKTVFELLLGYFVLVGTEILLKVKASLAWAEVSAGAVVKADNIAHIMHFVIIDNILKLSEASPEERKQWGEGGKTSCRTSSTFSQ